MVVLLKRTNITRGRLCGDPTGKYEHHTGTSTWWSYIKVCTPHGDFYVVILLNRLYNIREYLCGGPI